MIPLALEESNALLAKKSKAANLYKQLDADPVDWDLVHRYLPIVRSLVGRMRVYFPASVDSEDIYSIGLGALIESAQKLSEDRKEQFGAYAKIRVRGALLDELRRMDHLSRVDRGLFKRYRTQIEQLEAQHGGRLSTEEICQRLDISKEDYERVVTLRGTVRMLPLDFGADGGEEGGISLEETLEDLNQSTSRDLAEDNDLVELLRDQLGTLEETPKKVLALYYLEEMRLVDIAAVFGVSESRICQIHGQAVQQLRKRMHHLLNLKK